MNRVFATLQALLLIAAALPCPAREVQALEFRFNIPDDWYSEGGGPKEGRFFATGTTSKKMFAPPNVLVEARVASKPSDCNASRLPNPPEDFRAQGCSGATKQDLTVSKQIREVRWLCETVTTSDGPLTAGISIYLAGNSFLYVAHFSERGSAEVASFLDGVSRSVSLNSIQPVQR